LNSETLSTVEAGRILGRTRQTIAGWCKTGKLKAEVDPITGAFAIPQSELEPFIQRGLIRTEIKIERLLLTVEEASIMLNMTKRSVEDFIYHGELEYFTGPPRRIPVAAIHKLIEEKTVSRNWRNRI
jgi:hypothetical protein